MLAGPAANARASITLLKDPIRLSGRLSFMAGIALGCYCSSGWQIVGAFVKMDWSGTVDYIVVAVWGSKAAISAMLKLPVLKPSA